MDFPSLSAGDRITLNKAFKAYKPAEEIYKFPDPEKLLELGFEFKVLTSLRLNSVNVTEDDLLNFLSRCPLLENLCVVDAPSLLNFKIVGSTPGHQEPLKLKHLEIRNCLWLDQLEVSAAKHSLPRCS
ncbi:hypothetical protein ACH5RR_030661 [Cinchona calisaya]|uniref:At1g61320/AtMIF1 LRR domain-containing protein n=1 Tax=Cinchona calisaya TaxID=153742 RepID=A0ABD2YYS0_9GENT